MVPVSVEALLAHPAVSLPRLAPDGSRVAFLRPAGETVALVVGATLESSDVQTVHVGPVKDHRWTDGGDFLMFTADLIGDEGYHLFAHALSTGETTDLTPMPGVAAVLLGIDGDTVALALNARDRSRHDLFHATAGRNDLRLVDESPGFLPGGWLLDAKLLPRGGLSINPTGELCLWSRTRDGWAEVRRFPSEDAVAVLDRLPIGLSADARAAYVLSSSGGDFSRLLAVDLRSGHEREIARVEGADVGRVVAIGAEPLLVASEQARTEWVALGERGERLLRLVLALTDAEGESDLDVVDHSSDGAMWIVARVSPTIGRTYFVIDADKARVRSRVPDRPWLEGEPTGVPEPFSFVARDGLVIHGYLTRQQSSGRVPPPAVVWVHGGPWERDSWVFNPFVQFFASQGYACVQVNFRGSSGYGKRFVEAGRRQWGAAMQEDLLDAVEHLAALREVDPTAVAIAGGSYGGYAALAGAAFTPDRFRCAIAIVAPSNLATLIDSFPAHWAHGIRRRFVEHVGDPATEADLLQSRSPLSRVHDVRIPILLFHGAQDPRVRETESHTFAGALQALGGECQLVVFPDEGHGVALRANRRRLFDLSAAFLARHLEPGPRGATHNG